MFRQPKLNGQKLKATSGRGNGTNYAAPSGERVKMSDKAVAHAVRDEQHERMAYPVGTNGGAMETPLRWLGREPNVDERPANPGIKTTGPTTKGRKGVL